MRAPDARIAAERVANVIDLNVPHPSAHRTQVGGHPRYSRLTEADEEGTHDRLTTLQRELVDPIIREHRGRIVKNTGDGALVEFRSVDAVRCAIEVQRAFAVRNASAPQDHRIDFRLGVSLGDVIVGPNDIYGHSVNVAVRLEGLAVPGDICLTANAWHCVRGKIAAQVIDLGELHLKNITEPAQVYAIHPSGCSSAGA
jgi:adenylate cyclase